MTSIDVWAATAAGVAGVCLGIRGELLKPHLGVFHSAPDPVLIGMLLLAAVLMTRAFNILIGGHATVWEAVMISALAIQAVIMLTNLVIQRRGERHR